MIGLSLPSSRLRQARDRPPSHTINHCGYMISQTVSTLLAHHRRAGADLERWLGQWKPPDPKWWLTQEAA